MDLLRVVALTAGVTLLWTLAAAPPVRAQLLSPGPLSRDHAELEGDSRCGDCHSSARRIGTHLCGRCHADVVRTVRARGGLHGREYRDQECGTCHVEHRGRGTKLVRWPGGSPERFDHGDTGYRLEGRHARVACRDCHDHRNSRGQRTYLGASAQCASCHEDSHRGRFGNRCENCHSARAWSSVRLDDFDHALAHFPLRGEHRSVECAGCHRQPPRWTGIDHATCASCHRDPHAGRFGAQCASCHSETAWSEVSGLRRNHPGVSIGGGHSRLACERCHDRGVDAAPSRGSACASCHRPVHEAPFGNDCRRCHASIRWTGLPDLVGRRAHARTPFPLRGRHEQVECAACHLRELPRERRYRGLDHDTCGACHEDRHAGAFEDLGLGSECAGCHTESGFSPSRFGTAQHARTAFPLEGRHELVPCGACHEGPRPRLAFELPDDRHGCEGCHQNPHGDQFATEMQRGGCASCHAPRGWDQPNIDHSTWPLTGAHGLASCDACHQPTPEDRGAGRGASYRGVPRECAGCHQDVHAGQFRLSEPVRQCEACHQTTEFRVAGFDHEAMTGFPLAGKHGEARCVSCHLPAELRDGTRTIRWRLGYRECSECHADPHDEARRPRGGGR